MQERIPFGRLHDNVDAGIVQALVVAALSARLRAQFESDLLSFVLFDGDFADELISLGRHDAGERADEIISSFKPNIRSS